ncbi:hypothetical protein LTR84_008616 [Exophiala bonariae]|uniref:Sugar phosphate transporter domain-containing protein n=1 Tax=Exophiala bonariae TaxID=1690606 RepID=A0AAV9MWT6_9EURO|nr:hypothetical protein LTR84_008616 [Exophiala bonariae]
MSGLQLARNSDHPESFSDDGKESESGIPLLYTEKDEDLEHQYHSADVTLSKSRGQSYIDAIWMLVNVVSTVVIVFLNKIVFSDPQLGKCQISIAIWHFTATSGLLYASTSHPFRAFEAIRVPIRQVLPICIFFAGFLLLGNLSLALNDVDFYQLAKIMTTPTVVALGYVLFRRTIPASALLAVVITCFGVALVTAKSFHTNTMGTIVAIAAFTVTALYQVWIGKKIEELNVSPPQLLLNQAPVSVVLLLLVAPFVDTVPDFNTVSSSVLFSLFCSGFIASLLNLSQFFIIGRTSTLAFNVVSQVKTILILGISWASTGKTLSFIEIVGVCMALGGAWAYAQTAKRS